MALWLNKPLEKKVKQRAEDRGFVHVDDYVRYLMEMDHLRWVRNVTDRNYDSFRTERRYAVLLADAVAWNLTGYPVREVIGARAKSTEAINFGILHEDEEFQADTDFALFKQLDIMGVPTVIFYREGAIVGKWLGNIADQLDDLLAVLVSDEPFPQKHSDLASSKLPMNDDSPKVESGLLEILVCPVTRSKLRQEGDYLVAEQPEGAGLRYPIRDGIPILLAEEAELPEGVESLQAFRQRYAELIPE